MMPSRGPRRRLAAAVVVLCCGSAAAWRQWTYNSTAPSTWSDIWSQQNAPRGRVGHSMVLDGTRIILFGGRDDETEREHTPRTFGVTEVDGVRVFDTFERSPIYNCVMPNSSSNATSVNSTTPYYGQCLNTVPVGVYYNDVWVYELNCTRYYDESCVKQGWQILHRGGIHAECKIFSGREICQIPSERYLHSAVMFNDHTMLVYGGYSQRCLDYCDDLWSFDLRDNTWLEIYELGHFKAGQSPGKRWRFSMLGTGTTMIIFGGHRLWHGYASDNSWKNRWGNHDEIPQGGYLADMWVYEKTMLSALERVPLYTVHYGRWRQLKPQQQCFLSPGETWAERGDIACESLWPRARAGHAAVLDNNGQGMWVHGGYTTYFPYPSTASVGAGNGTATAASGGITDFSPYPMHPFYLDDLWYYNFTSGLWKQVQPVSTTSPGPRMDHSLVLVNNILVLMGGYDDNVVYDETWYFNITTSRWLRKETFVHAQYPYSCTDDIAYIADPANNCTELSWSLELDRNDFSPFSIRSWGQQPYYYPDPSGKAYWGILNKGQKLPPPGFPHSRVTSGTPIFPYAGSGPRQYARKFTWFYNGTHNASFYEWCLSVKGEPTRGQVIDGKAGRASAPVFIPQPRRQAPGWDGCRDRVDNRSDLLNELQWAHPSARSQHRVVYSPEYQSIYLYGGLGYTGDQEPTKAKTHATSALGDMWQFDINRCPKNCSDHGSCYMGFCFCDPGYYGVDCSNISCPGDFCYYDQYTLQQVCVHCCSAGYNHTDNDVYVENARKVPCSLTEPGQQHGVCDGFGTCQCAPPYLGDDCSIKDCKSNCSFNGYCSVEYPVSRCICHEGYFGEICQFKECLNNCTYPNGVCNYTTGYCNCRMVYNPFNNTRPYARLQGEDCSWIVAFAGAGTLWGWRVVALNTLAVLLLLYMFAAAAV